MDGHASGALVGIALEHRHVNLDDIKYYEINYGIPFDDSEIDYENDLVYMVDFSLQPNDRMLYLMERANLTWIDHHQTSCDWFAKQQSKSLCCKGLLEDGDKAACELVWEFYFDGPCPKFIKMISHYDIWKKDTSFNWEEVILPLQMYLETVETRPGENINFWRKVLSASEETLWLKDAIKSGNVLKQFNDDRMRKLTIEHGYEGKFCGYKAFILNSLEGGSLQFEAAIDTSQYDILVVYRQHKDEYWVVNLYSTNPNVNCGSLAKALGAEGPFKSGGGHLGAAGFQTSTRCLFDILFEK